MKQIIMIAAFSLLMVGCGNNGKVEGDQPSEICVWENVQWATDWMQKYAEYVRGNDRFFTDSRIIDIWNTWALAYIDDDKRPEMILLCPGEAYGTKVLTIHDNKVMEWNSWRCNAAYIPKSGLIENNDGSMGEYWNRVFRLEEGKFTKIFDHTDRLYQSHDKIDDTTCADEYYCFLEGDSVMRIGDEIDCHQYDQQKNNIYSSKGESVNFDANMSKLPTNCFEPHWHPSLPDGVTMKDYKITLSVR